MKVDKDGKAVNAGSYGVYNNEYSAKVTRTHINPVADSESVQEVLASSGYMVTIGEGEEFVILPSDFVTVQEPNKVFALDGQEVEVGDKIKILNDYTSEGTVKTLYPVSTLKGKVCCSIEEDKGSAPDGYYPMYWGQIKAVLEKANTGASADGIKEAKVGDLVQIRKGSNLLNGRVVKLYSDNNRSYARVTATEVLEGSKSLVGRSAGYLTSRIVANFGNMDNSEGEQMENEAQGKKKEASVGKVTVVKEGTQITLPKGMPLRTAIKELNRQAEQEELDVSIMEPIPGFPLDAAHAFVRAMEHKYGWVNALPTPGFFGSTPPTMIGVQVDPDGRTVQVPWGELGIPGISGTLSTGIQFIDERPVFCIGGTVKQRDKEEVNEIARLTKEYLRSGSIYRGKAIRIKFPENPKKFSPMDNQPKFIHTGEVRPAELIFSDTVRKLVNVNLWTLIQHTPAVRNAQIPIKRGVLVFGKYGVGKTLLAAVTAQMAVQQGVTFIDLEDSRQLPQAIPFARQLGGMVVIFAEDIDRCDVNASRTDAFNEILNTVDGLTSKRDEIVIVMTTNHIDRISPAMLRPGRLDAVVEIKPPDAKAVQELVRLYARHLLPPDEDIAGVGAVLAGEIPAVVREVVERSKLAAISRGDVHHITAEDLLIQAEGMKQHLELLKDKPVDDRSDLEKMGDAIGKRVAEAALSGVVNNLDERGEDPDDYEVYEGENLIGKAARRPLNTEKVA